MSVKRIGDWAKVTKEVAMLDKVFAEQAHATLKDWAEFTKARLRTMIIHGWDFPDLSPYTQRRKAQLGYSVEPYIETGTFLNNIFYAVDKNKYSAFVGVSRDASAMSGHNKTIPVVEVAPILEFGSEALGIPARPIFTPAGEQSINYLLAIKHSQIIKARLKSL